MWLVHRLGIHSRIAIAISALWVLLLVLFFADLIAIIPMPAMAAVIMLLGANMLKWEDIKPHLKNRGEAVVFLGSFLSVLFLVRIPDQRDRRFRSNVTADSEGT